MKYILKQKNKTSGGFTLIETLVAISIFTISVLTMLIVLSQGISSTIYAKKKATASYLAQEGIEYIRNIRDTYVLFDSMSAQEGWNNFTASILLDCNQASGCYFNGDNLFSQFPPPAQAMAQIPVNPCGSACPNLLYDDLTGKFGYTTGKNSGFTRQISVTQVPSSSDELIVTSTVYWNQGSGQYKITFSQNLFNWVE